MATRPEGWHPEDIKAAVRKRGTTLTQLALDHGLYASACRCALVQPVFRAEQVIAGYLGVPAQQLWPDRYDADGTPRHPHARARHLRTLRAIGHRQKRQAA